MDKATGKFIAAVKRMEKRVNVAAYVVINPSDVTRWGRIVVSYPKDGASRLHVIAWLPDVNGEMAHHHGIASGFGYDKATAAMGGAWFYDLLAGQRRQLVDQGYDFRRQLGTAGYTVIQAV